MADKSCINIQQNLSAVGIFILNRSFPTTSAQATNRQKRKKRFKNTLIFFRHNATMQPKPHVVLSPETLVHGGKLWIPTLAVSAFIFLCTKENRLMITFWQQEKGKLVQRSETEIQSGANKWIDARSVTREDIRILEEDYGVQREHILDILDQDELSRIEREDEYTLIILRLPVFSPDNDISYFTVPLGIVLYPGTVITICWTDCEVLKDITENRIRDLTLADFPAFVMRILSRADSTFLRYLKEINRRSTAAQNELERSIKNNELILLLNLEKSLVFFTTSLKSNQILLEKLSKTRIMHLDEEDKDWLEDVAIDNRQAIEMADTYSNILSGMMDAFASVISNNLNIVMKRLTVLSLILMVPTFIVSFFGMNVPLPFAHAGWLGVIIVSGLCLLTGFIVKLALSDRNEQSGQLKRYARKKKQRNPQ